MDKSLKRKIGYVPSVVTEIKSPVKKESKIDTPAPVSTEGVKLAVWLKSFSILNKSALCKEAEIDRGNFDKYLLKGEIPSQHIEPIKKVIKSYGYE